MRATLFHPTACRTALVFGVLLSLSGCSSQPPATAPPPDARRPQLRSEAELAAERAERVAAGEIVPATEPLYVDAERKRLATLEATPPAPQPGPGDITPDALIIDDDTITIPEVLYALRSRIEEGRRTQTAQGLREQLPRWVRRELQEQVGRLLLYRKAIAPVNDPGKEAIKKSVDRQFDEQVVREFDGSRARLEEHLRRYGLTLEQHRLAIERRLVVQQYLFETIRPRILIRRDELLDEYRRQSARFSSGETRELLIIEAPFDKFLPEHLSWEQALPQQQAQARLRATRHIREAQAALANESFEDVARRMSRGLHAEDGGSWGQLSKPLQGDYELVSAPAFQFSPGQVSDPIETPRGWYIVKCGAIAPAHTVPFEEAQNTLRPELMDARFHQEATEFVLKLAEKATFTSMEAFIKEAARRGAQDGWPDVIAAGP